CRTTPPSRMGPPPPRARSTCRGSPGPRPTTPGSSDHGRAPPAAARRSGAASPPAAVQPLPRRRLRARGRGFRPDDGHPRLPGGHDDLLHGVVDLELGDAGIGAVRSAGLELHVADAAPVPAGLLRGPAVAAGPEPAGRPGPG